MPLEVELDEASDISSSTSSGASKPSAAKREGAVVARMLEDEGLRSFWDFASLIRRTRSTSERESQRLRGRWLTADLVVQRVHGWGPRAVRILCVRAATAPERSRLNDFFERDRCNVAGRLKLLSDPLDMERDRVLVKLPYEESYTGWIHHERQVLEALAGIPGIPELRDHIYFEDINVWAAAYAFCEAPSLQDRLEKGKLFSSDEIQLLAAFLLITLGKVHERGWLLVDLHPQDVLLRDAANLSDRCAGNAEVFPYSMICGWAYAVRCQPPMQPPDLEEILNLYGSPDRGIWDSPEELPGMTVPSLYSSSEEFVGLFSGKSCLTPATDVYRAAAICLMAKRAYGPFGAPGYPVSNQLEPVLETLRLHCREAVRARSEGGADNVTDAAIRLGEESVKSFLLALQSLMKAKLDLSNSGELPLQNWFSRALSIDPRFRCPTTAEALETLDQAWSAIISTRLRERKHDEEAKCARKSTEDSTLSIGEPHGIGLKPRIRLEISAPPELYRMDVL